VTSQVEVALSIRAGQSAGPLSDAAPGADGTLIPVDIDATIVTAYSPALGHAHMEEIVRIPSFDRFR